LIPPPALLTALLLSALLLYSAHSAQTVGGLKDGGGRVGAVVSSGPWGHPVSRGVRDPGERMNIRVIIVAADDNAWTDEP
jgi:hypothetical protein